MHNKGIRSRLHSMNFEKLAIDKPTNFDVLFDSLDQETPTHAPTSRHQKETINSTHEVIQKILDDIIINTYSIVSLKSNIQLWKGKEELYDLGIIYKQQYKYEIQKIQEQWIAQQAKEQK